MGDVVNLDEYQPHKAIYAACTSCGKDWAAVAPAHAAALECPRCGEMDGERINTKDPAFYNKFLPTGLSSEELQRRTAVMIAAHEQGQ